jgi:Fic family protein
MKVPAKPPEWEAAYLRAIDTLSVGELFRDPIDDSEYLAWDKLRFKTPPPGIDHELWWVIVKIRRNAQQRVVPLIDMAGKNFHYALTDAVLKQCDAITQRASGEISLPELALSSGDRDRYVVNSLIEEAITSSQLEGASTTRRVAKQMIRSGRNPVTKGERMILNNYRAMEMIREWTEEPITPARVMELHRVVTSDTMEYPDEAGRLQTPQDIRIAVWGDGEQVLHRPPDAAELPARLQALCDFANASGQDGPYVPVPVRAIIVHYMVGYDHYFADGNGRTARLLFYWCMLRNRYWLTEYVTISRILKNAPSRYAASFLLSEDDDGDLTHFVLYHLGVFVRAIDELRDYLSRKAQEIREVRSALDSTHSDLNYRQLALLDRAIHDATSEFTVKSHGSSHRASHETARQDLLELEHRGLLTRTKRGKAFLWIPGPALAGHILPPR